MILPKFLRFCGKYTFPRRFCGGVGPAAPAPARFFAACSRQFCGPARLSARRLFGAGLFSENPASAAEVFVFMGSDCASWRGLPDGKGASRSACLLWGCAPGGGRLRQGFAGSALHPQGTSSLDPGRRKTCVLLCCGFGCASWRGLPDGKGASRSACLLWGCAPGGGRLRQGFAGSALHPQGTSSLDPREETGGETRKKDKKMDKKLLFLRREVDPRLVFAYNSGYEERKIGIACHGEHIADPLLRGDGLVYLFQFAEKRCGVGFAESGGHGRNSGRDRGDCALVSRCKGGRDGV